MRPLPLLLLVALGACAPRPAVTPADMARVFRQHDVRGTFVLHDVKRGTTVRHNPKRAARRMLPASTYKIPHALIAVETGVLRDAKQRLKWDGKRYAFNAWNRDHDLPSALRYSVVPFFQQVARTIGRGRMQQWIDRLGYGNRNISGPIDLFWLEGRLAISANEQVAFLRRFQSGQLPVSPRTQAIVRNALIVDRGPHHVLRAKTGWAVRKTRQHGWYVGWATHRGRTWVFAMNMDGRLGQNHQARKTITRAILKKAGALP